MRLLPDIAAPSVLLQIHALVMGWFFCTAAYSAPPDTQVDIGYLFDDNVTRGQGDYKMADQSISANLSQSVIFPVSDHMRTLMTGTLGGEKFKYHDGLSRFTAGIHGEFQYRSSAEFGTPVFSIFAKISADQYRSDQRDGFRYSTGISWRKTMTDRIRIFAAAAHNERNGRNAVFDARENTARLNLDYEFNSFATLYLGGEYRRGDIVITAPLWSVYNAAYTLDDVFSGWQLYNYRLDGSTSINKLGCNFPLGPRSSVDLSWNQARSTTSYVALPSWNKVPLNYITNQYSLVYLVRF